MLVDGESARTMVLQDCSFLVSESFGETSTFLVSEDNAAEVVVDGMVLVKAVTSSATHASTHAPRVPTGKHPG